MVKGSRSKSFTTAASAFGPFSYPDRVRVIARPFHNHTVQMPGVLSTLNPAALRTLGATIATAFGIVSSGPTCFRGSEGAR